MSLKKVHSDQPNIFSFSEKNLVNMEKILITNMGKIGMQWNVKLQ